MCTECCKPDWSLIPLLTGAVMAIGILTTYAIAVSLGHVDALLPAISDTGIYSPEMHIFSQVLNLVAALSIATFVLRYNLICAIITMVDREEFLRFKVIARINLGVGIIAGVGLSIVGNFQDNTSAIVHLIGATMVFALGSLYMLIDTVITKKMHPKYNGLSIFFIRLIIGIVGATSFVTTMIASILSSRRSEFKTTYDRVHWKPDDPGYTEHLVATFSEWIMGFSFICYFFTHIRDFSKFSADFQLQMLVRHLSHKPATDYQVIEGDLNSHEDTRQFPVQDETTPLIHSAPVIRNQYSRGESPPSSHLPLEKESTPVENENLQSGSHQEICQKAATNSVTECEDSPGSDAREEENTIEQTQAVNTEQDESQLIAEQHQSDVTVRPLPDPKV